MTDLVQGNQTILCCPCHGADEKGDRPPVEVRLYEVPLDDEPYRTAGLQRRMDEADATRVLVQSGIEENEAARAVSHLNAAYAKERWIGAESWRPSLPMRVAFMGAIFPSVRYQYRKDLWVLSQELQPGSNSIRRGHSVHSQQNTYENVPDWLQGGRATIVGPQACTCAWWEATLLIPNAGKPSSREYADLEAHLDEHSVGDWRAVLDLGEASELYGGCVSYLQRHGVKASEAKRRAMEYVAESISVMDYGGIDWPEGIENISLTDYTNAERYLGPREGSIDSDWPVIRYVLSQLELGE